MEVIDGDGMIVSDLDISKTPLGANEDMENSDMVSNAGDILVDPTQGITTTESVVAVTTTCGIATQRHTPQTLGKEDLDVPLNYDHSSLSNELDQTEKTKEETIKEKPLSSIIATNLDQDTKISTRSSRSAIVVPGDEEDSSTEPVTDGRMEIKKTLNFIASETTKVNNASSSKLDTTLFASGAETMVDSFGNHLDEAADAKSASNLIIDTSGPSQEAELQVMEVSSLDRSSSDQKGLSCFHDSHYNKVNSNSVAKEPGTQPLAQPQQPQHPSSSTWMGNRHQEKHYLLMSLPIDSLHSIASFLTPIEWRDFGQCSSGTNKISKEIFRRVRMHGFRCATEVVTALKCGQHADAKELCALYVSAGVPIYPHSLGHSYHTLIWRLSIEVKQLQEQQTKNSINSVDISTPPNAPGAPRAADETIPVDPFYNERDDMRMREELILGSGRVGLTYLEEKAMHKLNSKYTESHADRIRSVNWRRRSTNARGLPQVPFMPPPFPPTASGRRETHADWHAAGRCASSRGQLSRSNSFSGSRFRTPSTILKVHRHLLDQHLLGRSGVDDGEGSMPTPPVSLSADFFHPFFSFLSTEETMRNRSNGSDSMGRTTTGNTSLLPAYYQPVSGRNLESDEDTNDARRAGSMGSNYTDDSDSDFEAEMMHPRPDIMEPLRLRNADEIVAAGAAMQPPAMVPPVPPMVSLGTRPTSASASIMSEMRKSSHQLTVQSGILSNIELDVYSTSSKSLKIGDDSKAGRQLSHYLKGRFAAYHRCLERHISKNDNDGFEECILDFWDEFLPQTANIHYYDKHTAVPRISRLDEFLTKPCPKAVGIIQCEIERVKLGSKKSMKGRFFPTYEYRLFIRHRPADPMSDLFDSQGLIDGIERRDTVLMMAKNRGRKHTESSMQASKKGSNNYYLSLPLQDDLDLHHRSVNRLEETKKPSPNGAGLRTCSSDLSGQLGRLQSNFVGTEFQIFTSHLSMMRKKPDSLLSKSMHSPTMSDDEALSDSGRQGESSRRRSCFGRLSLRGKSNNDGRWTDFSEPPQPHSSPLALLRPRSGDATPGRNRKVSAAESFESKQYIAETQPLFYEQEDGAITYTANLLGSRPRIMDVCIPRVNHDGVGVEWKRYLENCKDHDGSSKDRLLNHLKQLQQNGQMDEHGRLINPASDDPEVIATGEQEYSPPGDFGLMTLQNRPPWWNVELGSFVLNFGGRVSVASVKNFQLCDRRDQDHIMLQFGRIEGRHAFTMDFRYPLTAVQAFAIAISSLQSKISFG